MAGHSHWAGIKHKKGALDKKRGKVFSKIAKEILIAARDGGVDINMNLKLRYAIDKAKDANMPKTNIERLLKKASGEGGGVHYEEIVYEGYGPGGTAIYILASTDNRNRTSSELRNIFDSNGGNLGSSGCVGYLFDKKGIIIIDKSLKTEDELMDIALEAGAEDLKEEGDYFQIVSDPKDFEAVKKAIQEQEIKWEEASITYIPQNTVKLDRENSLKILKLIDELEDNDDVDSVYSNYDIEEEIIEEYSKGE